MSARARQLRVRLQCAQNLRGELGAGADVGVHTHGVHREVLEVGHERVRRTSALDHGHDLRRVAVVFVRGREAARLDAHRIPAAQHTFDETDSGDRIPFISLVVRRHGGKIPAPARPFHPLHSAGREFRGESANQPSRSTPALQVVRGGWVSSTYIQRTNRSAVSFPSGMDASVSAVSFSASTWSRVSPFLTSGSIRSRIDTTSSRCAITALRSTMGPCPGMILVFGPASAIVSASAASNPSSVPPLKTSTNGYCTERK